MSKAASTAIQCLTILKSVEPVYTCDIWHYPGQLAGLVVSAIMVLVGLRKIALLKARIWDSLLLIVYLAGILFMGLRPKNHGFHGSNGMLQDLGLYFSDVAINILGFIPLGYLMMSYYLSSNRIQKKIPIACLSIATCTGVSLLIELSQHYIPGRSSSLFDLLFNGLGAFGGIIFCILEKRLSRNTCGHRDAIM